MRKHLLILLFSVACCFGEFDLNDKVAEAIEKTPLAEKLHTGVRVHINEKGIVEVFDKGDFLFQYTIGDREAGRDIEIQYEGEGFDKVKLKKRVVVVTHGWIDKGDESWPLDMAKALKEHVSEDWVCVVYDWRGGAAVINPIDAAKYARYLGGYRLERVLNEMFDEIEHIHFIGHSAGSWLIDRAAKELVAKKKVKSMHLTFLDSFIPKSWEDKELGLIKGEVVLWKEHYFTRDYTYKSTERLVEGAYNVDITAIEPGVKEHRFPFRWYWATITGEYGLDDREKGKQLYNKYNGITLGFPRSREFSEEAWQDSLKLGKAEIVMTDPGFVFWLFDYLGKMFSK